MISLIRNEMGSVEGCMQPIARWEVWYLSPFGLHKERLDAINRCQQTDLDPELLIQPVAVAIADDGTYERR